MSIEDLNNYRNETVEFLQALATVLGETPAQQAAIASLTDNTAGTSDGVLAQVPSDTLANHAAVTNDNFAEVNTKLDAIMTALRNHGLIET